MKGEQTGRILDRCAPLESREASDVDLAELCSGAIGSVTYHGASGELLTLHFQHRWDASARDPNQLIPDGYVISKEYHSGCLITLRRWMDRLWRWLWA
jgi:hypothetical protein